MVREHAEARKQGGNRAETGRDSRLHSERQRRMTAAFRAVRTTPGRGCAPSTWGTLRSGPAGLELFFACSRFRSGSKHFTSSRGCMFGFSLSAHPVPVRSPVRLLAFGRAGFRAMGPAGARDVPVPETRRTRNGGALCQIESNRFPRSDKSWSGGWGEGPSPGRRKARRGLSGEESIRIFSLIFYKL